MTTTVSRATSRAATPDGPPSHGPNDTRPAISLPTPNLAAPAGPSTDGAEDLPAPISLAPRRSSSRRPTTPKQDPIAASGGGPDSPATDMVATPEAHPSRGTQTARRQSLSDTQRPIAAGTDLDGHARRDTQPKFAVEPPGRAAEFPTEPRSCSLLDPALALAADVLDDLERVRVANANRIEVLTREGLDKDGVARGFGLSEAHPDVMRLARMVLALQALEHDAELNLKRLLRAHPLGAWVKAQRGVGEKQAARLLAAIGDPFINGATGAPRTVSALWAYCGLHTLPVGHSTSDTHAWSADRGPFPADQFALDTHGRLVGGAQPGGDPGQPESDAQNASARVAARRRKGERANWSVRAKMRAYLIAESCVKQLDKDCRDGGQRWIDTQTTHAAVAADNGRGGQKSTDTHDPRAAPACSCSPYRVIYDARRAHTAVTRPDWTDGHSHNDALRITSKAVLRDLWRAAKAWHEQTSRAAAVVSQLPARRRDGPNPEGSAGPS